MLLLLLLVKDLGPVQWEGQDRLEGEHAGGDELEECLGLVLYLVGGEVLLGRRNDGRVCGCGEA